MLQLGLNYYYALMRQRKEYSAIEKSNLVAAALYSYRIADM